MEISISYIIEKICEIYAGDATVRLAWELPVKSFSRISGKNVLLLYVHLHII